MTNIEKQKILDEIEKHSEVFSKASRFQYRIRCPVCGDSQKNLSDSHCYIKCTDNPDEPLLFNCFLCNKGGIVGKDFLLKLGIDNNIAETLEGRKYNRINLLKNNDINLITGHPMLRSPQIRYIENRLGPGFTKEDYDRFKIVWDFDGIYKFITNQRLKNSLPSNIDTISFLSDDKTSLMTRTMSDESIWRKISLVNSETRSVYTIKTQLDLFTSEEIEVNIAEGIFDILSVYKNFSNNENSVYIATLGSDYISGINYAIMKGIIGNNVIIKIYIDNDNIVNEYKLKMKLKKFKWLFKNIYIYKNIKGKDVGVKLEEIKLMETKL